MPREPTLRSPGSCWPRPHYHLQPLRPDCCWGKSHIYPQDPSAAQLSASLISMRHSPSVTKATSCSAPSGVTAPAILVRGDPFPSCLPLAQPWKTRRPKDPSLQTASSPTPIYSLLLVLAAVPLGCSLALSHVYLWHLLLFTLLPQAGSDEWHCRRSFLGYSIWLIRVSSPVGKRLGRKRQYLGCYRTGCLGS